MSRVAHPRWVGVPMLGLTNGHEYLLRFGMIWPNIHCTVTQNNPDLHDTVAYMTVAQAADHIATVTDGAVVGIDTFPGYVWEEDIPFVPELEYDVTMWNTSQTWANCRVRLPGATVGEWIRDMQNSGHWKVASVHSV